MEISFGPHKGSLLSELPLEYLNQLIDDIADDFDLLLAIGYELNWRELNETFKQYKRRRRKKRC
jgi:hypothetical protein